MHIKIELVCIRVLTCCSREKLKYCEGEALVGSGIRARHKGREVGGEVRVPVGGR
jgi:hypothetical protein